MSIDLHRKIAATVEEERRTANSANEKPMA